MNYGELKSAILGDDGFSHRTDLSGKIDMFIGMFEARANRELRVPEMENRATAIPTDEYVALPTDFLELRNIQINTTPPTLLEYAAPQQIDATRLTSGTPCYYTVVGNEFQINPSAAGLEVEISYFQKIPALSDSNPANWLLDSNPDYYLLGIMTEIYFYTIDEKYVGANQMLQMKEASINLRGKNKAYGSGPMVITAV